MAGKHSKKPDTSDDQAKIEPASFWRRITELVPPWIAAAAAVVVAIAAVLALLATGTISSTSTPSVSSNGSQLTVTDAVNGGAWSRSDPTQGTLPTHVDRPTNAVAWIVNGRIVTPTCAKAAAAYPVIYATEHQQWRWWAELPDHSWIPMAAFKETMHDGPFTLRVC